MEQRLTELESRIAFQEDAIQKLNDVVVRQQAQYDKLLLDLANLVEQVKELAPATGAGEIHEPPPPHY